MTNRPAGEDAEPLEQPGAAGDAIEGVIHIRRFDGWGALRRFAAEEAAGAAPERPVCLIAPSEGAVWVLERRLRSEIPVGDGGAAVAPAVLTAARALGDLAADLPEGGAPASRLTRETILEEALAAEVGTPGAPPGEVGALTGPLLAFLDEQAADRGVTPDRPAFEAFCERAGREFRESEETDEGAARLAELTEWLRRAHRRYLDGLGQVFDPDRLRRALLRAARAGHLPQRRWARVAAFGENALSPADCEVFAALGAPEGVVWALPADAPAPPCPAGVEFRETPADLAEGEPGGIESAGSPETESPASVPVPLSLFARPAEGKPRPEDERREAEPPADLPDAPPTVFVPETASSAGGGGDDRADEFRPFVETDRDEEVKRAARLLQARGGPSPAEGAGPRRYALVAQRPESYLAATEAAFPPAGIPLRTPERPLLAAEPRAAGLGALLDFAERPEFLPNGLALLRDPFRTGTGLSVPPARAADLAERALGRGKVRATLRGGDPAAAMRGLAARFRAAAARFEERSGTRPGDRPEGRTESGTSIRERNEAREDAAAAEVLEVLSGWSDSLRAFRAPGTSLESAAAALLDFDRAHTRRPTRSSAAPAPEGLDRDGPDGPDGPDGMDGPDGPDAAPDAVSDALEQARAAAADLPAGGGGAGVAGRLGRLLLRRRAPRPEKAGATGEGTGEEAGSEVHLVSAADAVFGDYDFVVLLGLVDADWPGPRPTNIFFPHSVLEKATRTRHAGLRAAEVRLLRALARLPNRAFAFSRPAHEDGFPAGRSTLEVELTEELRRIGARPESLPEPVPGDIPAPADPRPPLPRTLDRRAPSARVLDRPLSPTALDRYAESPAEFFARQVLFLEEEPELTDIAPPTERGLLLHEILERGVPRLAAASGDRASARALDRSLDLLRECFAECAGEMGLDETEAAGESLWLFGHEAEPGALEWFLFEDWGRGPAEPRDFERRLKGEVEPAAAGAPPLVVSGRVDRMDTLPDGRLRVLEYKSGRFHKKPLQARLYARILETGGRVAPDCALLYFGSREWIGSEKRPTDSQQDETIRTVRDGLARGEFGRPPNEPKFGMPLVSRHDLHDLHDLEDPPRAVEPDRGSGDFPSERG